MASRWTSRPPASTRTRRAVWLIVAATLIVLAGIGATALLTRSGDGGSASSAKPTTTGRQTPLASGDAVLQSLPRPRASGHLLVTTADCRLELITLPSGQAAQPRPDVRSCQASLLPSPWLAVAAIRTSATQPTWMRLGARGSADQTLPSAQVVGVATSREGSIAICRLVEGGSEISIRSPAGAVRSVPGCSPAWWRGELVRIDAASRVVDDRGDAVLPRRRSADVVAGISVIASSPDESHLVLIHGTAPALVATVFDDRGRALSDLPLPAIGGRVQTALVSNDGRLIAVLTNTGWTIARADARVSAITDVAQNVIIDVAFAPDSSSIAVALTHRVAFLDPATLGPVAQLPVEADTVDWGT